MTHVVRQRVPVERCATLIDVLAERALRQADDEAYILLDHRGATKATVTFAALQRRATALAARLLEDCQPGDRALLIFPQCLEFIVAFFGCLVAGIIAVPMMAPRRMASRDQTASIVADCGARLAITSALTSAVRSDILVRLEHSGVKLLPLDEVGREVGPASPPARVTNGDDIVFLQYTSGSTCAPKGVMVTHTNLVANLEMMRRALGTDRSSTYVSWVPLYHDMGLILNALESLYVGAKCALMSPAAFLQRPLGWLRAIDQYQARVAGAPNFAFDLCVDHFRPELMEGLDLSCWQVCFNAAEAVRSETIRRFADTFMPYGFDPRSTFPCYGMAEATVMISGGCKGAGSTIRPVSREGLKSHRALAPTAPDDCHDVVGCGRALVGERIAIVNPETRQRLPANSVGEIWTSGPNVARGYWRNDVATRAVFNTAIEDEGLPIWLRTGDLGFLDEAGDLFVTGRIKDIIVIRGMNHYPQDIEATVEESHPALCRHGCAVFAELGGSGQEQLIVVQEIERSHRRRFDREEVIGNIREAVATEHELFIRDVVLIRPGSIPKTTSGKIRRSLTRELWRTGKLELIIPDEA